MTATMQKTKAKKKGPAPPIAAPKSMCGVPERLSPEQLQRHPDNRRPAEASIAAVAESLSSEGQIEAVLVRCIRRADEYMSCDTYQIISGETRWLAAKRLHWDSLDCEVVELDDAATLRVLAAANAARQDLDPIAQARLIVRLCEPIEAGGSGLTREAAAKMFDLQSGGAASNLVRLLDLPQLWQDRVAAGELAQSYARELLPLIELGEQTKAWDELDKEWNDQEKNKGYGAFESRMELGSEVERLIEHHTRPVERNDKRRYQKEGLGYDAHPIRFKLTTDLEERLRIVRLTINEVPIRRATNCELYDSLQIPEIKTFLAKKEKGRSGAADHSPDVSKKLSPKQQAAEDAERRDKAAEQLAKRIEKWRAAWLRELVAVAIVHEDHADLAIRIVAWQQVQIRTVSFGDANNLDIDEKLGAMWGVKNAWQGVLRRKDQGDVEHLVAHWLRVPARDHYSHPMPDDKVEDLVELLKIDIGGRWDLLQSPRCPDRERYQEFFELHNSEQLDALGRELEVGTSGATKKSGKVSAFLNAPKTLRLPKSLKPLRGKRGNK